MSVKSSFSALLIGIAVAFGTQASPAPDTYPNKPVRVLVPLPAGSGIDVLVRAIGKEYTGRTGQPLLIENKPGANTIVSTNACSKAPPDGYTLCVITSSYSLNPYLYNELPFDPDNDIKPITQLIFAPEVVLMNPKLPVNSFEELRAYSKEHPDRLNYASFGIGGTPHLAFEWLKREGGLHITHIPYSGSPPALLALMAGEVDLVFVSVGNPGIVANIENGKTKALLVPGSKRSELLPDVPSFEEVGLPKFALRTWHGLAAPAGTPDAIINKVAEEFRAILSDPAFEASVIRPMAVETVASTPEEFARYLAEDRRNGEVLVRQSGAKAE